MNAPDSLPTKAKELRALLLAERALHAQERTRLAEELGAERKAKDHAQDEMKRLMGIIKELQRNRFGRRSERLDFDQLMLAFEDVEQAIAAAQAVVSSGPASVKTGLSGLT
jgi:predicted  nucleic acid-binding Zn-ribbon protein